MRQPSLPPNMNESNGIQDFIHSTGSFDPTNEDFLDQMLSSVPSNPWVDIDPAAMICGGFEDKMRHHQQRQQVNCNNGLMLQQQLLGINNGSMSILNSDLHDNDSPSFNSANMETKRLKVKALLDDFSGSIGQTHQQFHHTQLQGQSFGAAVSGSSGGGGAAQPKQQRVRARRGQATDPHSIAERLRRERIAERMKSLQELVPNADKTDKASMLDEIIDYVKFLQLQVKVLNMSRLGGAAAVAPLGADKSSESRNGNGGAQTASSSNEGVTITEQQVAKLMKEDMGSAMQYLQGKGLCLMPISLATAISTTTTRINNRNGGVEAGGPASPGVSALTVQSAAALASSGKGTSAKAE